ncbi:MULTISPECIES: hypothetical protein [unclassified Sinorhizobium]|uniref:hypothetical protein n=1 Tax=unclassified Sinorhizobium TaxID=2613772 RepID=UPI0035261473
MLSQRNQAVQFFMESQNRSNPLFYEIPKRKPLRAFSGIALAQHSSMSEAGGALDGLPLPAFAAVAIAWAAIGPDETRAATGLTSFGRKPRYRLYTVAFGTEIILKRRSCRRVGNCNRQSFLSRRLQAADKLGFSSENGQRQAWKKKHDRGCEMIAALQDEEDGTKETGSRHKAGGFDKFAAVATEPKEHEADERRYHHDTHTAVSRQIDERENQGDRDEQAGKEGCVFFHRDNSANQVRG